MVRSPGRGHRAQRHVVLSLAPQRQQGANPLQHESARTGPSRAAAWPTVAARPHPTPRPASPPPRSRPPTLLPPQVEWGSGGLSGLFAQPSNLLDPRFLRMLLELYTFQFDVQRRSPLSPHNALRSPSLPAPPPAPGRSPHSDPPVRCNPLRYLAALPAEDSASPYSGATLPGATQTLGEFVSSRG